jgi:hypothetical protein
VRRHALRNRAYCRTKAGEWPHQATALNRPLPSARRSSLCVIGPRR